MPSSHDQSPTSHNLAQAATLRTLELVQSGGGWIVGTYTEDQIFEQLLPHGEANPYSTEQAAIDAAKIWQEIRPEFSLSI